MDHGKRKSMLKSSMHQLVPSRSSCSLFQVQFSDLMHEIRFRSMTLDEFTSLNTSFTALLTSDENKEIIEMINSEEFQPKIFKSDRRNNFQSVQWDENAVIECIRSVGHTETPYLIKTMEKTTFTVNRPVALGTFFCASLFRFVGGRNEFLKNQPRGRITIIEIGESANSNRQSVCYNGLQLFSIGGTTRVTLPKPMIIRPGSKYEIQIKMQSQSMENLCTRSKCRNHISIKPDISVAFNDDPIENAARGFISRLEFNRIWMCSELEPPILTKVIGKTQLSK